MSCRFCTYHEKVVRDVFIHYAKATALQNPQTEQQKSSANDVSTPSTQAVVSSVAVIAISTTTSQSNDSTVQASREQNQSFNSTGGSIVALSDSEDDNDLLSLQSRFKYLHKVSKNPLSGLDFSRTILPATIRKLLHKRYGSDKKNASDNEATSSCNQNLPNTGNNSASDGLSNVTTQEQTTLIISSVGTPLITMQNVVNDVTASSLSRGDAIAVHSIGTKHGCTDVTYAASSVIFSQHKTVLLDSTNSYYRNDGKTEIGDKRQTSNVLINTESIISHVKPLTSIERSISSFSCSVSYATLDSHPSILLLPTVVANIPEVSKKVTQSVCKAAPTTPVPSVCMTYSLGKSVASQSSLTSTIESSAFETKGRACHWRSGVLQSDANCSRSGDSYQLSTGATTPSGQSLISSKKQGANTCVPTVTKGPVLGSSLSSSGVTILRNSNPSLQKDVFTTNSTVAVTSVPIVLPNVNKGISLTGDVCKVTTSLQPGNFQSKNSNVSETRTVVEKVRHVKPRLDDTQGKGLQQESTEQTLVRERSQCSSGKEQLTCLTTSAQSIQSKGMENYSNSTVESDSDQRNMLRTFFDHLSGKEEDKMKESMRSRKRKRQQVALAFDDVNKLVLTEKGYVHETEANNASSGVENDQFRNTKHTHKKNGPQTKRSIEDTVSSEFKRPKIDKSSYLSFLIVISYCYFLF